MQRRTTARLHTVCIMPTTNRHRGPHTCISPASPRHGHGPPRHPATPPPMPHGAGARGRCGARQRDANAAAARGGGTYHAGWAGAAAAGAHFGRGQRWHQPLRAVADRFRGGGDRSELRPGCRATGAARAGALRRDALRLLLLGADGPQRRTVAARAQRRALAAVTCRVFAAYTRCTCCITVRRSRVPTHQHSGNFVVCGGEPCVPLRQMTEHRAGNQESSFTIQ